MSNNTTSTGPLPASVVLGLIVLTVALLGFLAYSKFSQPAAATVPAAAPAGIAVGSTVQTSVAPGAEFIKGKDGSIVGPEAPGRK